MDMNKVIGIVGTGKIGGSIAKLLVKNGYQVILASKNNKTAQAIVLELGIQASINPPERMTEFADIIILSAPLSEIPFLSLSFRMSCKDKILIDTCNPSRSRDGKIAFDIFESFSTSSIWLKQYFPKAKIVKAFNTISDKVFIDQIGRKGSVDIAIPIASDDDYSMQKVYNIVQKIGFTPVIAGNLDKAKHFGPGTMPYGANVTGEVLQKYFSTFCND